MAKKPQSKNLKPTMFTAKSLKALECKESKSTNDQAMGHIYS